MTGVSWTPTAPARGPDPRGPDPRGPGRDGRRGRPALIFSIPILVTAKVTEERWKLTLSAANPCVRPRPQRIFMRDSQVAADGTVQAASRSPKWSALTSGDCAAVAKQNKAIRAGWPPAILIGRSLRKPMPGPRQLNLDGSIHAFSDNHCNPGPQRHQLGRSSFVCVHYGAYRIPVVARRKPVNYLQSSFVHYGRHQLSGRLLIYND